MRGLFLILISCSFFLGVPVKIHSTDRITISLQQPQTKTEIEITYIDNRIKVKNATVNSKLEIYSVVGLKVLEFQIKNPVGEYPVNLPKGYYIVRVDDTVRKIVVR